MKMPLGRPNCFHSARNRPSWSKIWMRLFGAIGDEQAALAVHGEAVRLVELARGLALAAPRLDELAVL